MGDINYAEMVSMGAPPEAIGMKAYRTGDPDWHSEIWGWSDGIHPYYQTMAEILPSNFRVVELGTYYGRGLLHLLECLHRKGKKGCIVGVDPGEFPGSYRGLLTNLQNIRAELDPSGIRVDIWREKSSEVFQLFDNDSLDLVFIDADHSEKAVREDIQNWLPKVKPRGILAGHDYGHPEIPGVARAVDALLSPVTVVSSVWEYRKP